MATIARGQAAPPGFMITSGGVSGVCQAGACTIEPIGGAASPVEPIGGAASPVEEPAQPTPPAVSMMPRNPLIRQPTAPQACFPQPDGSCRPPMQDVAATASPVVLPEFNPGFTDQSGASPYDVWRAQSIMAAAKSTRVPSAWKGGGGGGAVTAPADPARAAELALLGASAGEAARLRRMGVDYGTAAAMALRNQMEQQGLTAAGYSTGAIPGATKAVNAAAQREAERTYWTGGEMTPAGRAVMPEAPGTIVQDAAGNLWQAGADGMQLVPVTSSAAENWYTGPLMIGGQVSTWAQQQAERQAKLRELRLREQLEMEARLANTQLQGQQRLRQQSLTDANRAAREAAKDSRKTQPASGVSRLLNPGQ